MTSTENNRVIKSHGIGEIFFDEWESACYQADHFSFNKLKEIPFFKILLELNALQFKYITRIDELALFERILLRDIYLANIDLMKTFEEIVELCDDLFANGYIRTMEEAIDNFYKYMDDIEFDFFDYGETRELMNTILIKLDNFDKHLESVLNLLPFIMNKSIFTKYIIKEDFLNQLTDR